MATKNRIGLQFSGFEEMAARLDELQGDLQRTTEEALIKSKEAVTAKLLEATNNEVRYNPNAIWQNRTEVDGGKTAPVFEVTELSQMTDPLEFVRKTIEHYPSLNPDTLEADFAEIEKELMVELCVPQS